jgi:hypothetical protein
MSFVRIVGGVWGYVFPDLLPQAELSDVELESLRLVQAGKGWRVEYSRLETLINKGMLNSLGTKLTEEGKRRAMVTITISGIKP